MHLAVGGPVFIHWYEPSAMGQMSTYTTICSCCSQTLVSATLARHTVSLGVQDCLDVSYLFGLKDCTVVVFDKKKHVPESNKTLSPLANHAKITANTHVCLKQKA